MYEIEKNSEEGIVRDPILLDAEEIEPRVEDGRLMLPLDPTISLFIFFFFFLQKQTNFKDFFPLSSFNDNKI